MSANNLGKIKTLPKSLQALAEQVSKWPGVQLAPHCFGGLEFRLNEQEIGHIHSEGMLDIRFSSTLKRQLKAKRVAEDHHFLPDSGWVTLYVRHTDDLPNALFLLRLAYLRLADKLGRREPALPTGLSLPDIARELADLKAEIEAPVR